jgi:hypothetical protein
MDAGSTSGGGKLGDAMIRRHAGRPRLIAGLKPYRGKPAVRNFRGGNGNVGIIRSPVRAIALPDRRRYAMWHIGSI